MERPSCAASRLSLVAHAMTVNHRTARPAIKGTSRRYERSAADTRTARRLIAVSRGPATQHTPRRLLDGERVTHVVAVSAVDEQVPLARPLGAEAELLHDPSRRGVLRPDVRLDAVQPRGAEAVVGHQRDGARRDAATRE